MNEFSTNFVVVKCISFLCLRHIPCILSQFLLFLYLIDYFDCMVQINYYVYYIYLFLLLFCMFITMICHLHLIFLQ